MAHRNDIKPGSVWRSKDKRDHGRTVTVESVDPSVALYGNGFVHVRSVRRSTLRWRTLFDRYELVAPAPAAHLTAADQADGEVAQ